MKNLFGLFMLLSAVASIVYYIDSPPDLEGRRRRVINCLTCEMMTLLFLLLMIL